MLKFASFTRFSTHWETMRTSMSKSATAYAGTSNQGRPKPTGCSNPVFASDVGAAPGRRAQGQPQLESPGDPIVGTVECIGIDFDAGAMLRNQNRVAAKEKSPTFNLAPRIDFKPVDRVEGRPEFRQLASQLPADATVQGARTGPATLELCPNARLPAFRHPLLEPLEGYFLRGEFTLVAGEIICDCLEVAP